MHQEKVEVLYNDPVGPSAYRIGLGAGEGYDTAMPGQFVMLRISEGTTPLLRRPFSIHSFRNEPESIPTVEILYKVVGTGTRLLTTLRPGDCLDMLGPLGKGFSISRDPGPVYIAAGGVGVAPMLFLVQFLERLRSGLSDVHIFLGGRTDDDLLCREEFERMGLDLHVTTDDGSAGDQCFVTHPLELAVRSVRPDVIYACGPLDMLKCIIGIAMARDIRCEVSVEAMMACGMGACLGCAVEGSDSSGRYLHACMDGPVFQAETLKW